MGLLQYKKPEIISHSNITFETGPSNGKNGKFPGLGWGVDGVPAEQRGDYPGGNPGGFPGKGPQHDHRP